MSSSHVRQNWRPWHTLTERERWIETEEKEREKTDSEGQRTRLAKGQQTETQKEEMQLKIMEEFHMDASPSRQIKG